MIDYQKLKAWRFPEVEHTYTAKDTMLYALSVGLGADPVDERQLAFVYEKNLKVLPTMAVILGYPGSWMEDPATGINFTMVVHGEELIRLHRPLPAQGRVVARHHITRVVDKGAGRGALVIYDKDLHDGETGEKLATVTHTTFCRGDGGFSAGDEPTPPPPRVPNRAPEILCEMATLPQQALLYRLSADMNPLHADPATARAAGFRAPILHGLATYGIAGHALLKTFCDYDPAVLRSLQVRFSAPVYPGETLRFEFWREGREVAFRARVAAREVTVLDHGRAELAG
jgi:acyl dehydratase